MNVPFLERTLRRLKDAGIDDVILPAGYLPEAIRNHFGDGKRLGLSIRYVIEQTPLGTAGAIKNVAEFINGPFFVLNGDILTSLDLRKMRAFHEDKGGMGVLHLIRVDDPSAFGCVVHDTDGAVGAFVEKPPRDEAPTNEVNAGTYLLEPAILDLIPSGRMVSIERETFPLVVAGARPLYAYTTSDYWIDLGSPAAYTQAHRDIFNGEMPLGVGQGTEGPGAKDVPAAACIPPVFVGDRVEIESGASVGPYVVLGDDCKVGAGATIRDSIFWNDVRVERDAIIEGAIVASHTSIGAHAVVARDTVIGQHSVIRANARIAEHARITAS